MQQAIKTVDIKGKQYITVAERVRILHEMRKSGEIKDFEMVESTPFEIAGQAYWRVSARIDGKFYIGSAEIKLNAAKGTPDGTNPISCAETSAFGRMLAFAGLGTVDSIASWDDVCRATHEPESRTFAQQTAQPPEAPKALSEPAKAEPQPVQALPDSKILPGQFNALKSLYLRLNEPIPVDLSQWSFAQARATIIDLQAKLKRAS